MQTGRSKQRPYVVASRRERGKQRPYDAAGASISALMS